MKKLYTLILAAMATLSANADKVTITLADGSAVAEGATVTFNAEEQSFDLGGGMIYTMVSCDPNDPYITNVSGADVDLSVTLTSDDYKGVTWCGVTSQCQKMSSSSVSRSATIASGAKAEMQVHGDFNEKEYGTRTVNVDVDASGEKHKFTIKLVYSEATGVEAVKVNPSTLSIYNMNGQEVRTNELERGRIYVINGKKFLVK